MIFACLHLKLLCSLDFDSVKTRLTSDLMAFCQSSDWRRGSALTILSRFESQVFVPEEGVEPSRACAHGILSAACLPNFTTPA